METDTIKPKKFDRHQILIDHYKQEIKEWDWKNIVSDCYDNPEYNKYDREWTAETWIGNETAILPSGKIYAFWTSNQTRADEIKDSCFMDALEEIAELHGLYVTCDDGIRVGIIDREEIAGKQFIKQFEDSMSDLGINCLSCDSDEPYFSHNDCEICGQIAGDRYDASGYNPTTKEIIKEISVCSDCICYAANGDIPTQYEI